jgi:anti-sigma factor RsiW
MRAGLSADCRRVLASVSAYLDSDLDATTCESIEAHCRQCASCANVIAGLRETVGLCRKAGSVPVPDAVRQRARERVWRLLASQQNGPSGQGSP